MKKYSLALCLFALSPQLATAQEAKNSVVMEEVQYTSVLPAPIRKVIPTDGVSRFWGASGLKFKGQQVWLHVYDLQKTDFSAKLDAKAYAPVGFMKDPGDGVQKSALDIYLQNNKKSWKAISRVRFEYLRYGHVELDGRFRKPTKAESGEVVEAKTFWLNARSKTKPTIQIDFTTPAFFGANFLHLWVVFPNGLDKKPIVQAFQDASGGFESRHIDVLGRDQTGNVLVKYSYGSISGGRTKLILKWQDKGFVVDKAPQPLTPPEATQDKKIHLP